MVNWGFATQNDDGSITGNGTDTTWTDAPTYADMWNEMVAIYDGDYQTLSDTEAAESSLFSSWMTAIRQLLRQVILLTTSKVSRRQATTLYV